MKLPSILTDLIEIASIASERIIANPKTSAFVSAYSVVAGLSAFIDWFSEALPKMAILAGLLGALILAYLNWKKIKVVEAEARKLAWEAENAELRNRELREAMLKRNPNIEMRKDDKP